MRNIKLFRSEMDTKGRTVEIRACGIDLGTTNSSVAEARWVAGEKPVYSTQKIAKF